VDVTASVTAVASSVGSVVGSAVGSAIGAASVASGMASTASVTAGAGPDVGVVQAVTNVTVKNTQIIADLRMFENTTDLLGLMPQMLTQFGVPSTTVEGTSSDVMSAASNVNRTGSKPTSIRRETLRAR
jgi:hypothetical protein